MTAQGLGASLSPLLGGLIAQHLGFQSVFLLLGGLSLGSLIIWSAFAPMLRRAGHPAPDRPGAGTQSRHE